MPSSSSTIRKLAAIMFTDIAGFTALSSKDSLKASELLNIQREKLQPIVEEYNGKWLKEIGDGLLLTFDSATSAVECAIDIQKTAKNIDGLKLRIGIHEGEVILQEGDVIGDDVNIAARIEPFSAVGGIAISQKVQQAISSNREFKTKFIGQPKLKGVAQEVKVHCITSHGLPETKLSDVSAKLEKTTKWWKFAIPIVLIASVIGYYFLSQDKNTIPSIAVMYMEINKSSDLQYFTSITEDLIIDLAKNAPGLIKVSELKSVLKYKNTDLSTEELAKSLDVEHIFTSNLTEHNDGFNLKCRLIEASTGMDKFINRWYIPRDKVQTITTILVKNILESLKIPLVKEIQRPTVFNPQAYELYLKGKNTYITSQSFNDIKLARDLLKKSFELDNSLIPALYKLAYSHYDEGEYDVAMELAAECLDQSMLIGDRHAISDAHRLMGQINNKKRNFDLALDYFEKSLEIKKELSDKAGIAKGYNSIAIVNYRIKDFDGALQNWMKAIDIAEELRDKQSISYYQNNIGIYYHKKLFNYQKALEYYTSSLDLKEYLGEERRISKSRNNIGQLYFEIGDFEHAMEMFATALEIKKKLGDKRGIGITLKNIADVHLNKSEYDKAFEVLNECLALWMKLNDFINIIGIEQSIGIVAFTKGNYPLALEHFSKMEQLLVDQDASESVLDLSWSTLVYLKMKKKLSGDMTVENLVELVENEDINERDLIPLNWNMHQIFIILKNEEEADDYLESAYLELKHQSKRIKNKKNRTSFLNNIKLHKDIVKKFKS